MNVELRHLRVMVLVAEAGSVGRAARWLKVSQPSLTAQLKRIESAFGGELFERSRTGVTPTPLGRYAWTGRGRSSSMWITCPQRSRR